jgi:23S rRNA pseudouridine1911/1915/1917 synthase
MISRADGPEDADGELGEAFSEPEESAPASFEFRNEGEPVRLDIFLSERLTDKSRTYLQRLVQTGYVTLEPLPRRAVRPSYKVPTGTVVTVRIPPPLKVSLAPEPIPLDFLYEDDLIAVVNKPAGLSAHPAPQQTGSTLVNALLYWLKDLSGIAGVERPGIVHRLDKETSGVLLVAKNDLAHRALSSQFKERTIHKTYLAISRGRPNEWEGRICLPLARSATHSKKIEVRSDGTGRTAITDYRVLEVFRGYSLIELYPLTGRTHQIRVHLATLRLPVACDKLYGREKLVYLSDLRDRPRESGETPLIERHALHAASISFRHPVTREEMTFSAPLHDDMLALLRALQTHRSPR